MTKLGFKVIYKVRVPKKSAFVLTFFRIMVFRKEDVNIETGILLFQYKTLGGAVRCSLNRGNTEVCGWSEDL